MDIAEELRSDSYVIPVALRHAAADEIERLRVADDVRAEQAAWAEREACARYVEKLVDSMPAIWGDITAKEMNAMLLFLGERIRQRHLRFPPDMLRAVAAEREACAKIAESMDGDFIECDLTGDGYLAARKAIAAAIRAR
jgi:hypothetical protein